MLKAAADTEGAPTGAPTPAQNAATVRDGLRDVEDREGNEEAALDALRAQAEAAEAGGHPAVWWKEVTEDLDKRLIAMRAERDAAVRAAYEQVERTERIERAAEQAREALRPFVEHLNPKALMQGSGWSERFEKYIEDARAALTGEGT